MKHFEPLLFTKWVYLSTAVLIVVTLSIGCDSSGISDASTEEERTSSLRSSTIKVPAIINSRMYFEDFEDFGDYISYIAHVNDLFPLHLDFDLFLRTRSS